MFIDTMRILGDRFPRRDVYPFHMKVFLETDRLELRGPVSFFAGENGTGKSTLLEAVGKSYGLTVWGGEKTHVTHRNPLETRLCDFVRLTGTEPKGGIEKGFLFRAENFFNYASYLDDLAMTDPGILRYYGGASLNRKSHGEAFLSFFGSRCRMPGIYLLDEPEAALSPSNQLSFVKILLDIAGAGTSQFVISSHSPILLSYPGAQIFTFDRAPIREIAYEETRSYLFYKSFMSRRESHLGWLRDAECEERAGTEG